MATFVDQSAGEHGYVIQPLYTAQETEIISVHDPASQPARGSLVRIEGLEGFLNERLNLNGQLARVLSETVEDGTVKVRILPMDYKVSEHADPRYLGDFPGGPYVDISDWLHRARPQ